MTAAQLTSYTALTALAVLAGAWSLATLARGMI